MNKFELQQAVLSRPKQERAHLASVLLDSLDQPSDSKILELWLREADRRAAEIDDGMTKLVTAEELETQVQAIFK